MELEGTKRHLKLATCEKWTLTKLHLRPFGKRRHNFDNKWANAPLTYATR